MSVTWSQISEDRFSRDVARMKSFIGTTNKIFPDVDLDDVLFLLDQYKNCNACSQTKVQMCRVKGFWYLSPMRAAKVQASLRIRTVSSEPPLLAHTSSESR